MRGRGITSLEVGSVLHRLSLESQWGESMVSLWNRDHSTCLSHMLGISLCLRLSTEAWRHLQPGEIDSCAGNDSLGARATHCKPHTVNSNCLLLCTSFLYRHVIHSRKGNCGYVVLQTTMHC